MIEIHTKPLNHRTYLLYLDMLNSLKTLNYCITRNIYIEICIIFAEQLHTYIKNYQYIKAMKKAKMKLISFRVNEEEFELFRKYITENNRGTYSFVFRSWILSFNDKYVRRMK